MQKKGNFLAMVQKFFNILHLTVRPITNFKTYMLLDNSSMDTKKGSNSS